MNNISHVSIHPVGLADTEDTFQLNFISEHTGSATLANLEQDSNNQVIKSVEVPVLIGDEVLLKKAKSNTPIKLIKIDVEGFELRVLAGLKQTLTTHHPLVSTEFIKENLQRAGITRTQLTDFMLTLGYKPYGLGTQRKWLRHKLRLTELPEDIENAHTQDVLWIHQDSAEKSNMQKFIV